VSGFREGNAAIVTGASSGIGRALCLELAARGGRLALAARDRSRLEDVAAACRERGAEAIVVPTDVGKPEDNAHLVATSVDSFGRLDVLVANAGFSHIARFDEVEDLGVYEELMRVNYLGAVHAAWHALPHLKRSRGQIVAVASASGLTGVPTRTGYSASKHAMIGFFESLRVELRGSGVGITIAAPDFVWTQIHHRAIGPDGQPLGRNMMDRAAISAEACARSIVGAMDRRQRLVLTSGRSRLGRWLRPFLPGLVDLVAARATRRRD
jgi:short-subunit dehydrogenase